MAEITIGAYTVLVDDTDYELVSQYTWVIKIPGKSRTPYAYSNQLGKFMHVLIMGTRGIDHENHNGLDNRRENLRISTAQQNMFNRRKQIKKSGSIYKGVRYRKDGMGRDRWTAQIVFSGKYIHLGTFDTEVEAAKAYNDAAVQYFGGFASVNPLPDVNL
jgi:hypothetical protein